MTHCALGIDIGGTNIAFGLVTAEGEIIFEHTFPTRQFENPIDFVQFLYHFLEEKNLLDIILGIGIGAPNGNHFTGEIQFAPNLHWKGIIPLAQMFEDTFHKPAILTNDANAAAYGEKMFGNAKDLNHFVTITLGTGLGSGVVIDSELIYGGHGIAGEFGHIRIIPGGRKCGCGRFGCLETYVSATGVVRSIKELASEHKANSKLTTIENPSAQHVFELAKQGDLFAEEIVEYTATLLGSCLADFACFSDPEAFILFGGIAQSGIKFAEKVKAHMEANILYIYKDHIEIRISDLHDKNAAVLGTAASTFWKTMSKK